ncbi:MAG: polysulfide reductase NrfD [Chloroflexi bacterium]|nr:polysulfide reductase NrfD [Chloroflexota bacterium]
MTDPGGERAPYGRRTVATLGDVPAAQRPATSTYYGLPALKPSDWGWLIAVYFFIGGMAGAAQVIAQVADLAGRKADRPLVARGRYLALAGSLVSPVLLIADLHTPSRWYNMLRIVRLTSAMSIGSWTLFSFGTLSGLAATAQALADLHRAPVWRTVARIVGTPAAVAGALMATYTGVLLAATSTPLWASVPRLLPTLFGLSSTSAALGALSLLLPHGRSAQPVRRRLDLLSLLSGLAEVAVLRQVESAWRRRALAEPLDQRPVQLGFRVGVRAGTAASLVIHALQVLGGRSLGPLGPAASLMALASSFILRAVVLFAGKRSAVRPEDAFRMART